ncbi:MAG: type III pantothenate kinase [Burkholderiales bacterium]|nr:type III pantothenate kinase [Burkholderiales bacterium]
MYLLIDSGNTRIKWAFVTSASLAATQPGAWLAQGAVRHAESAQLASQWQAHLCAELSGVLIANVAGATARNAISQQLSLVSPHIQPQWFSSQAQVAGVQNRYAEPTQLGCDRLCAVIGAQAMLPGKNLLIANCGTATTLDGLQADGQFIGGMILPGLALMAQSLARNTAQLPQVSPDSQLPHSFADNTQDAIISGCVTAQAGAIEKAVREFEHRLAQPVHCVLSGGAAFALAPALTIAHQMLDNLVLLGLHRVLQAQGGVIALAPPL